MRFDRARIVAATAALGVLALSAAPAWAGETEPDMLWADTGGGTGGEAGFRVAALTDGGTVTFGYLEMPSTFGSTTLNSAGASWGLFLVKHDANGNVDWSKAIDEGGDPMAIAATSDGGFVVAAAIYNDTTFEPGESDESIVSMTGQGMAIAKYDGDGDMTWVHGTSLSGQPLGIAVFADDSFVVAGNFKGAVTFGPASGTTVTVSSSQHPTTNAYYSEGFVARYQSDGDCDWVEKVGTTGHSRAWGVAALSDGSCIVGGDFNGSAVFDDGQTGSVTLSATNVDLWFARYESDGTFDWAQRAGGSGFDQVEAASVGSDDSVVFTGRLRNGATFAPGTGNATTISGRFFAARFLVDGTLEWVAEADGTGNGWGVGAFADGSWVITGWCDGTFTLGAGETNEAELVASADAFIARFADDGTLSWAERIGGTSSDIGYGVATLDDGTFVVVGEFQGTTKIGVGEINEASPTSVGGYDAFFAKYRAFAANVSPTGSDDPVAELEATMPSGGTRDVQVDFSQVDSSGVTSVTTSSTGEPLPNDYKLGDEAVWYDVETTASYTGTIELCFTWNEGDFSNENNMALFHYEDGAWVDITTSLDTTNNVVCGQTSSLSPFVLAEIEYDFGGIEQPVNADGSSVFKSGRVVPLKFGLTGPGDEVVEGAVATLKVFFLTDEVLGTDEEIEATSPGNANTGSTFRYDSQSKKYVFNLGTKGLETGHYRIDILLDDGSTHSVKLSIE